MPRHSEKFGDMSPREAKVLAALMEGCSNGQAAKLVGITKPIVARMRLTPRFRKFLAAEVQVIIETTRNRLLLAVNPALKTLIEIASDQNRPAAVRVNAASSILANAFKACELATKTNEVDIRDEIDAIYRLLDERDVPRKMKVAIGDTPSPN
jgi:uncharacterized protein (UPF0147 family)